MWLQLISALNYTSKSSKEDGGEKANDLSPLLAIPTTTFNENTIVDVLLKHDIKSYVFYFSTSVPKISSLGGQEHAQHKSKKFIL